MFGAGIRQELAAQIGGGWSADNGMFRCPCGHRIEDDGQCPNGCISPMRQMGLI